MAQRTRPLLGWLVLLVAGAALLAVQGATPARAQFDELSPAERERAATVYAVQCASCHGAAGEGGVIPGADEPVPPLADSPAVTVPYVDLVVRVGRMPPPENDPFDNRARNVVISDVDRLLLVRYLDEEFDLEGAIPTPAEGDPAVGRVVYATNCAQCHGSTGAGGVAGGGAWTPPVADRGPIAIAEAIRVGPFEMPAFGPEQIPPEQVSDVAAFLAEVAAEPGTPVTNLIELNPVYASGIAAVLVLLVVLSLFWIAGRPSWFPDPAGQHRPRSAPGDRAGAVASREQKRT